MSTLTKRQIQNHLKKSFIKVDDISEILSIALDVGQNVFLYGKGGHGKSAMITEVQKLFDKPFFIQSCGQGLTEDRLFGGTDINHFKSNSTLFLFLNHN